MMYKKNQMFTLSNFRSLKISVKPIRTKVSYFLREKAILW